MTPSYNIPGRHKGKEGFFLIRSYLLKKKTLSNKDAEKKYIIRGNEAAFCGITAIGNKHKVEY